MELDLEAVSPTLSFLINLIEMDFKIRPTHCTFQFMHLWVLSLEESLHACSTQALVSEGHVFVEIGCNNSFLSLHGSWYTVGVPSVEWWCDFNVKYISINFCVWTLGLHLVALFWKVLELLWGRVTLDEINHLGGHWSLIDWAFSLSDFYFLPWTQCDQQLMLLLTYLPLPWWIIPSNWEPE